ncbi:MAG TPA: hypothetical protein VEX38_00760 [Fimbriimonadaceae bacterium]|nr:hypothetical protein [Fimbriimonadaceae bacterium]
MSREEVSPVRLLDRMESLMLDLSMIEDGKFGRHRIPPEPGSVLHAAKKQGNLIFMPGLVERQYLIGLQSLRQDGWEIGAGLFGLLPPEQGARAVRANEIGVAKHQTGSELARLWTGSNGRRSEWPEEQERAAKQLGKVLNDAIPAALSDPSATISRPLGENAVVYARAITLKYQECLVCHSDKKLGDPNGVITVYARKAGKSEPRN